MSRASVQIRILFTLALLAVSSGGASAQLPFDLLLTGGRVVDGTGNPWFQADVGIRDGRIVAVGALGGHPATEVIDVAGRYVAPGFIDIHSHADDGSARIGGATIRTNELRRKSMPNIVAQGITTAVVNHDGRSPWPIAPQRTLLETQGVGANVMLMVGHGTIRREVLGDDVERPSTPEEVARMRALLRQGLAEGAVGLSAGLEYEPGRWSETSEVVEIARELVAVDGVYISHERAEGADPMWFWPSQESEGPPTLIDAVLETIEIGRRTGARVVASHIKAKGAHWWGTSSTIIQLIEAARAEGVQVFADQYPYPTSGTDGNTVLLPRWALFDGEAESPRDRRPYTEMLEIALADPALAADLRGDTRHEIRRRGGADRVMVFEHPDASLVGKTLADVAAEWDLDEVETAIQLQLRGDPRRAGGGRLRGFSMSEEDVEAYGARSWVATTTDGGLADLSEAGRRTVHPRFYGTFPRKIAYYARDRGIMTVESAIRASTSLPAQIMGIRDRGQVREGFHADLVVFDLEALEDRTTFFEPHAYPSGIEQVLVNGTFVIRDGRHTDALAGRVLTAADRGAASPSQDDRD